MSDTARTTATTSVSGFPAGAKGVTPPTSSEGTGGFLSDVIVELGFVERETVERTIEAARDPGRTVERILLETGALTEDELSRAIAERYGFDHVDLDQFEVNMGAARLLGRSTALRYRAVPIAFATDGALIVAVADPVDTLAISDIEVMTKSEARKAVASGSTIDALAQRLPDVGSRQPAANRPDAADAVSPPSPASPTVGPNPQPSASPPASAAPGGPRPADSGAAASAVEASNGDADRERREAEARSAALEAELAKAHGMLREQSGQAEAERSRLREQAREAAQERDRLREAVVQITQERDRLSRESQQGSAELTSLRETAQRAESLAEGASGRIRELRDELTAAEERNAALARRLSGLKAAAVDAKAMAQKLMALHGALAGGDLASDGDVAPSATSADPRVPAPAGNGRGSDADDSSPAAPTPTAGSRLQRRT